MRVRSRITGAPVAGATVRISRYRDVSYERERTTNARGDVDFPSVPVGFLVVTALKEGYRAQSTTIDMVLGVKREVVVLYLAKPGSKPPAVRGKLGGFKEIADVRSRPSVRTEYYDANSAFAPLFHDLVGQMNSLGGADIHLSPSGGLGSVSLEGADPSMTSTTFDGVQVQSAAALDSIDADALQSASVNLTDSSLNLFSLNSTPTLQTDARLNAGGIGNDRASLQESGTAGQLGYAVEILGDAVRSPLDGQTYRDTSGFTYKHSGRFLGGFIGGALSIPIGKDTTLSVKHLRRVTRTLPLQALAPGPLLQGYGPFPVHSTDFGTVDEVNIQSQLGSWQVGARYYNFLTSGVGDYTNAYVAGNPAPADTSSASNEGDFGFTAIRVSKHDQTLNINGTISHSNDFEANGFGGLQTTSVSSSRRADLFLDYNSYFGKKQAAYYELTGKFDRDLATGDVASKLGVYLKRQHGTTTLFGSLQGGTSLALVPEASPFSLPNQVQYNCSAATAVATAPNDVPSTPAGFELRAGVTRSYPNSSFSAQIYDRRYSGVTLSSALVPASLEPPGFVPPSVLSSILAGFATFGGCGASSTPAVYFEQNISGATVDYRGLELGFGGHIGRLGMYQLLITDHQATLDSADPRLRGALSTYIPGAQLPGIPPLNASASVEFAVSSKVRALVNDTLVSSNNQYHLPAYGLLTGGLVGRLSRDTSFTIVATNLTHAYAAAYASSRYATGVPTVGGIDFQPLATPLTIPQLYIGVHFLATRQPF